MYVHIPGGVDETPVEMTISASPGDAVKVRVANGRAWVTGNQTAPPTDDTEAILAKLKALQAEKKAITATESAEQAAQAAAEATTSAGIAGRAASIAQAAAEAAQATADSKKVVFTSQPTPPYHVGDLWVDGGSMTQTMSDGTNDLITSGAELLEALILGSDSVSVKYCIFARTEGESFSEDDWSLAATDDTTVNELREWFWHDSLGAHILGDATGYRNDIDSTGMHIVDTFTETEVARFAADGAQIGKDDGAHSTVDANGFSVSNSDSDLIFETKGTGSSANAPKTFVYDMNLSAGQTTVLTPLDNLQSGDFVVHLVLTLRRNSLSYQHPVNITYTKGTSTSETYVITTSQNPVQITCRYDGNKSFTFVSASPTTASPNYPMVVAGQNLYGISYDVPVDAPYFTFGVRTGINGGFSFVAGNGLYAADDYQAAFGRYNDPGEDSALTIGNGTSNSSRSNALSVDWSGNMVISGDLTTGSDIDWTALTLNSACTAYSTATTPHYKRKGDLVTLIGDVKPTAEVTAGGAMTIGQLPAECCPAQRISFLCQGSGTAVWLCQIAADGTITAGRYRTEAGTQGMTTSTWLPFAISYMV